MSATQRMPPGERRGEARAERFQQLGAVQESGGRIAAATASAQIVGELALVARPRRAPPGARTARPRARPSVRTISSGSAEPSASSALALAADGRAPAPLQAGGQRALERGVRRLLEQIHERLADDGLSSTPNSSSHAGLASTTMPSCTCRIASLERCSTVSSWLRASCADFSVASSARSSAERAQLAQHHRLQPRRAGERHHVARPECHGGGDAGLVHRRAPATAPARSGPAGRAPASRPASSSGAPGTCTSSSGLSCVERIAQIAQRGDPGAMRRLARAPQQAVDCLDGVARGAQHDERNGVLLGQDGLRRQERRILAPRPRRCRVRGLAKLTRPRPGLGRRWRPWRDAAIIRGPLSGPRQRPHRETDHGQLHHQ